MSIQRVHQVLKFLKAQEEIRIRPPARIHILILHKHGKKPAAIADILGVTESYVYKILRRRTRDLPEQAEV